MRREVKIISCLPPENIEADSKAEAVRIIEERLREKLFFNSKIAENAAAFSNAVDDYHRTGYLPRRAMFPFSHCPEVLAEIWEDSQPLFMPKSVLDKLERYPDPILKRQGHASPVEVIKQLPVAIHDPIAIFISATDTHGKTLIALLDLKSADPITNKQQNICTALEFDVSGHINKIGLVKSAYGKSDSKYQNWFLSDHSAIYVDEKRTGKWLSAAELQLLGGKPFPGSFGNILTKEQFVKSRLNKISAFLQFDHEIMEDKMPKNHLTERKLELESSTESRNKESKGRQLISQIENSISELEKKIDSPETEKTIRDWLICQSKFHNYSMMNTFWMEVQSAIKNIPLSQVASFRKWTEMKNDQGEKVRIKKGAQGFSIIYPKFKTIYQKDEDGNFILDKDGNKIPEKNEDGSDVQVIFYGVSFVFDISQTNAIEIGAVKTLDHRGKDVPVQPDILDEAARRITEVYQFPVRFVSNPSYAAGGWFDLSDRSITINRAVSKSLSHQLGTLFHELGHGILHGDPSCNFSRELEEGQAEAFAYAAAAAFGIERRSELYIKSWIENDVPLADVMKNISTNVRDAFEKLNLEELAIKNSLTPDPLSTDKKMQEESAAALKENAHLQMYNCIAGNLGELNNKQALSALNYLEKASPEDLTGLYVLYQTSIRESLSDKLCAAQLVMEIDRKIKSADRKPAVQPENNQMKFNF